MNEKLEQTIICLVCDNYDDVSVGVDGLKDCDKCTLSFFTEIQEVIKFSRSEIFIIVEQILV